MLRGWLAHLTDALFGYGLRHRRWRRWPLLAVLALVWLPLALVLVSLGHGLLSDEPWSPSHDNFYVRYLAIAGALGQALVGLVIVVFLPLVASRAFAREKAAGNMLDLVLLPVQRRRLLMGRLGKVLLPFALLVLWAGPAYLATPLAARYRVKRWGREDLPLLRMTLAAPAALAWSSAVRPGWYWAERRRVPLVGEVWWGKQGGTVEALDYLATLVPFGTVLSFAFFAAVCGVYLSLRRRTWPGAALGTYVACLLLLGAELVPFAFGTDCLATPAFTLAVLALAVALRGVLPLLLLRDAGRRFDRYALGER